MSPSELSSSPTSIFRFLDFPEGSDGVLTLLILPSLHSRTSRFSLTDAESAFDAVRCFEDDRVSTKTQLVSKHYSRARESHVLK